MKISASLQTQIRLSTKVQLEVREFIYLAFFGIFSALSIVERSLLNIHLIYQAFVLLMLGSLSVLFILQRGKKPLWKMLLISMTLLLFFAAAIITDKSTLLLSVMLLITADQAKFNNIVKCAILFTLPALIFVMACSQVGIIPDYTFSHNGLTAHGMGYSYYATVPYSLMFLMICYLYLRGKHIHLIELAGLLVCNELVYFISTTRLTYYLFLIVTLIFVLLVKFSLIQTINKWFYKILAVIMYPAAFAATIWCARAYRENSSFWRKINEFTNTRLALSNQAFKLYQPKLLGQYIHMVGNGVGTKGRYFYIDSGYVYSYLANGILFTFALIGIYTVMSYLACCTNNKRLLVWLLAIASFSVINNVWTGVTYNPLLLSFLPMLLEIRNIKLQKQMPPFFQQILKPLEGESG